MPADVSKSRVHRSADLVENTPVAAITNASEAHVLNAAFSDVEVEAALNALGVKVNAVLAALRTAGLVTA